MNTPTPTPRTDEVENKIVDLSPSSEGNYFLMKAHARKLERELTTVSNPKNSLLIILEDGSTRTAQNHPDPTQIWSMLVDGEFEVTSIIDITDPAEPKSLSPNLINQPNPIRVLNHPEDDSWIPV